MKQNSKCGKLYYLAQKIKLYSILALYMSTVASAP